MQAIKKARRNGASGSDVSGSSAHRSDDYDSVAFDSDAPEDGGRDSRAQRRGQTRTDKKTFVFFKEVMEQVMVEGELRWVLQDREGGELPLDSSVIWNRSR